MLRVHTADYHLHWYIKSCCWLSLLWAFCLRIVCQTSTCKDRSTKLLLLRSLHRKLIGQLCLPLLLLWHSPCMKPTASCASKHSGKQRVAVIHCQRSYTKTVTKWPAEPFAAGASAPELPAMAAATVCVCVTFSRNGMEHLSVSCRACTTSKKTVKVVCTT